MSYFKLSKEPNGYWKYLFVSSAETILLYGIEYTVKEASRASILSTKLSIHYDECFELIENPNETFHFIIRSIGNSTCIGTSAVYSDKRACLHAMKVIRKKIKIAEVEK